MWISRGEMRKKIGASGQGQLRFSTLPAFPTLPELWTWPERHLTVVLLTNTRQLCALDPHPTVPPSLIHSFGCCLGPLSAAVTK